MRAAGLAAALLCAAGLACADDMPCPGAVPLRTERDYLVNLQAALRTSCLHDDATIVARLQALFAAPEVATERRTAAAVIYTFAGRIPGEEQRGREAVTRVVVKSSAGEAPLLSANVGFKGPWGLTRATFHEIWQGTLWGILPPHHPSPRNYARYTLPGNPAGSASVTTDDDGRLLSCSYWDEPDTPQPAVSAVFCSNACRAPAWAGRTSAANCPEKPVCGDPPAR
ncbi:hypothetical protein [Pseudoduganella chitinolytica]|uniref:Lipoprotein n=1 Tax=Pseudoduganella chitinolytica TaxID=34070 RepID=A0ABY8B6N4_9BURK|nr:hypothetical protein [Pseudoduganella chitinolytica]WEF31376.1 hypothetical protein PX653_18155 [Pseudoduganella chitinolytica]